MISRIDRLMYWVYQICEYYYYRPNMKPNEFLSECTAQKTNCSYMISPHSQLFPLFFWWAAHCSANAARIHLHSILLLPIFTRIPAHILPICSHSLSIRPFFVRFTSLTPVRCRRHFAPYARAALCVCSETISRLIEWGALDLHTHAHTDTHMPS